MFAKCRNPAIAGVRDGGGGADVSRTDAVGDRRVLTACWVAGDAIRVNKIGVLLLELEAVERERAERVGVDWRIGTAATKNAAGSCQLLILDIALLCQIKYLAQRLNRGQVGKVDGYWLRAVIQRQPAISCG